MIDFNTIDLIDDWWIVINNKSRKAASAATIATKEKNAMWISSLIRHTVNRLTWTTENRKSSNQIICVHRLDLPNTMPCHATKSSNEDSPKSIWHKSNMSLLNKTNVISNLISIADVSESLYTPNMVFCLIIDKINFSFVAAAVTVCRIQSKHFIRRAHKTQSESEQYNHDCDYRIFVFPFDFLWWCSTVWPIINRRLKKRATTLFAACQFNVSVFNWNVTESITSITAPKMNRPFTFLINSHTVSVVRSATHVISHLYNCHCVRQQSDTQQFCLQ